MYLIIAGGGSVGAELIRSLIKKKNDIVVIDKDKDVCDDLFAQFGIETVNGNATKISVLKGAGIEKADFFIATMPNDADNLAAVVLAKSFSVPKTIALMKKKSYYEAYKTAGVSTVLNIVDTLVMDILYQVEQPDIRRVADLGKRAVEIFIVRVPEKGKIIGKTVSELASDKNLPEDSIIAGIYNEKENEFKIPHGNTQIKEDSDLFVITKPELVTKTAKFLTR